LARYLLDVEFYTNHLLRCYEDIGEATRSWGPAVARRYIERINLLYATDTFRELYNYRALRLHPLHGEYAGRFAINLTGRYRLIIGQVYTEDHLVIYEVNNHYGD
jgi:proteic killer suppression protein